MNGAREPRAWRRVDGGVSLRVRVTPKASRDDVQGVEVTSDGPAIKVRVRAVPEDGAANAAVAVLIAQWLGLAKSSVVLSQGGKSRVKTLMVTGDAETLARQLEVLTSTT